jgi:hypothetical protein
MKAALVAAIALAPAGACATDGGSAASADGGGDASASDAATDDRAIFVDNGITLDNGLKLTNGLDLSSGDDVANGIKLTNGVNTIAPPPGSDLEAWIDADPTMRLRILRYEVECALPADTEVTVVYREQTYSFPGSMGLGASWSEGPMTVTDQERVSACLIARVNIRGNVLHIMLVGPYPGLDTVTAGDLASYPNRESTLFGNLFLDEPVGFIAHVGCGNRACTVDEGSLSCSCGLLDLGGGTCVDNGLPYDTECTGVDWDHATSVTSTNLITTYVAQEWAGGACQSDVDCIYYNCAADGTCGGFGAMCSWDAMCAAGTTCGEDLQCGGRGAVCDDSGDCLHDNCSLTDGRCGGVGTACDGDEACWGYYCNDGTCQECSSDGNCPDGWTCWVGRCVPEVK